MHIAHRAAPAAVTDTVFTALALFSVCLRVYTRTTVVKILGTDDCMIIGSMAVSVAYLATVFLQIKYGLGRTAKSDELEGFLMALWGTAPLYNLALFLCKLSITIQLYRIFCTRRVQILLRVMFAFLVVHGVWAVVMMIIACIPIQKYWKPQLPGDCASRYLITFVNSTINIATDIALLLIPSVLIRSLNLPRRQRVALIGIFTCGIFACIVSIVRLWSLHQISVAPQAQQSVEGVDIAIWSCLEINVGIICACVPAIKPLATKVFPRLLLSGAHFRSKSLRRDRRRRCGKDEASCRRGEVDSGESSDSKNKGPGAALARSVELDDIARADSLNVGTASTVGSENNLVVADTLQH